MSGKIYINAEKILLTQRVKVRTSHVCIFSTRRNLSIFGCVLRHDVIKRNVHKQKQKQKYVERFYTTKSVGIIFNESVIVS